MAIDAADWTVDRATKKIAYIGDDHDGASPSYITVIEFHRWLQSLADDAVASGDDELDITNTDPSRRSTDNIITLINGYALDETAGTPASEHLFDGSIIEADGDTIWDGIVNFGNADVQIQLLQDGGVVADDWWNYNDGGAATGGSSGQVLEDTGKAWTIDALIGYSVKNVTDGSWGIITDNTATTITTVLEGGSADVFASTDDYLIGIPVNSNLSAGISHRFMAKVREDGVDIDGRRIIGTSRRYLNTFGEFKINGTSRGNNVLALTDSSDLNNATPEATVEGWTNISNTEGLNLIDIDADTVDEEYYSQWQDDSTPDRAQNDFYERAKWLARDGSVSTIHGMVGELFRGITHAFAFSGTGLDPATNDKLVWGTAVVISTDTITMLVGEAVHEDTAIPAWKGRIIAVDDANDILIIDVEEGVVTTGETFTSQSGTGQTLTVSGTPTVVSGGGEFVCLAVDDDGATGNLYIQISKGTSPPNSGLIYDDADLTSFITLTTAPASKAVDTPFIGASTGSNIIGAYGIGFNPVDVDDSDILTALDGLTYSRPNLVTNTISGLTNTGDKDYVIVAPWDGTTKDVNDDAAFDKGQMLLAVILDADDEATVQVKTGTETAIPADTPASGTLRVVDDLGFERWIPYSSWSGTIFTIDTGHGDIGNNNDFLGNEAAVDNEVYVTYIDTDADATSLSWQSTYDSDRDLVALVRNGGSLPIKQFISEWALISTNQTLGAIRTTDA